jgi:hypothetical protein
MADKYDIVSEFKGYVTKPDSTNTDDRYLTKGSFNVLINDGEKITGRNGYELLGAASSTAKKINSEFTWNNSGGAELLLRGLDDELKVYFDGAWVTIADGFATSEFGFPRSSQSGWWDTSESIDILPFVAKDSNIYAWSGCITTIASATTDTITKNGTETWAEARALTTGNKVIVINGTEYTYTGGETTTTLTGVTPDPSGEAGDSVAYQKVITNSNKPGSGLTNDLIDILKNQVYVGDYSSREVYVSTQSSYVDFSTISTPRTVGQAALFTLDNTPKAFAVQEQDFYISAGRSDWYKTRIELQNSGSAFIENITVEKLKNAPYQAAKEKDLVANIKNSVVFISNEPTLDELGRVESVDTPQSRPLSDPIKPDFNSYDFTGGDIRYFKNQIFISVPVEGLVLIYDINNSWWQPPQRIPVGKFSIYNNTLVGHSSTKSESYTLFVDEVYADNGSPIDMQAVSTYRTFGERTLQKGFDEYYTEGYLSSNTNLTLTLQYNFEGGDGEKEFQISGSDTTITTGKGPLGGLGALPLGQGTLGSLGDTPTDLKKFRQVNGMPQLDFYELRTIYSTTDTNARFEIVAHGPQVRFSQNQNNAITK